MQRNWPALEQQIYMPLFRRMPVTLVRGEGAYVWDDSGKQYLDFVAGWAVNNLGHCHPAVVEAVQKQAATLMTVSNQFYTVPQLELAERLVNLSGYDRVFLANSGAEANEGAVKLARRYGMQNRNGAYTIVSAWHSFHGRTLAMVAATGKPAYQEPFRPLPPGFKQVDFNDIAALKAAVDDSTAAILIEPVQGEGGVHIADASYLRAVRALCDELGLLLIFDEVQTGIGRVGSMFAFEQYGIRPDILTLGKALAGGLPVGAFLASDRVASAFKPGDHGSTFGGNPLVCAAGVAALDAAVAEDIAGNAKRMGEIFVQKLKALQARHPEIREVRGLGLLIAIEFVRDMSDGVVRSALEKGLLLNAVAPNAIRFMPPLTITEAHLDEAISALESALSEQLVPTR